MKKIIIVILMIIGINSNAQINETESKMLWTTIGVSKKIDDKYSVNYTQIHSFDLNGAGLNFIQPDLRLNYKINKKLIATAGYSPTFSIDNISGNQLVYHRISGRIRLRTKIGKRIRMSNSITAEQHFTQRSKFKQRYYYKLDLYYRDTKLPWKLRPYVSQKLYLYTNGKPTQYFDSNGDETEFKSPNGLHAYRIQAGVKFYPTKKFHFSVYFLEQAEFNAGGSEINILDPNTNSIKKPFYNFEVIGLSCGFSL